MKLFSFTSFPSGHYHIEFLNWFVEYNPTRGAAWFLKRPWPNSKRGLPARKQKSFHIPLKRRRNV